MADRQPIGEALNGLTIFPLAPGCVALECVVIVKEMNEDGNSSWALRYSDTVSEVELIGSLHVMLRHQQDQFESQWIPDEDGV